MQDNQLLYDLENIPKLPNENNEWLSEQGITTYTQLFDFIKDETKDASLRANGCWVLFRLTKSLDRRRAIPPLLSALKSDQEELVTAAIQTLGSLGSRRAIPILLEMVSNISQSIPVRFHAIDSLALIGDKRAIPLFRAIIDNTSDNLHLRSRAIEELFEDPDPIDYFIQLLSDSSADIRFWAAYRLGQAFTDNTPALSELDGIVAYDHAVPIYFGWHIDREALLPLEHIYHRKVSKRFVDEDGEEEFENGGAHLISPAPEYYTFLYEYRKWQSDSSYLTLDLPEVTLHIDPQWLAEQLRAKWPEVQLNVREPRSQAYVLDWQLTLNGHTMIGGLHRDQYAFVITGDEEPAYEISAWYRGIIPDEQPLFFYEWADYGIEMRPGMSATELEDAIEKRDQERRR